MKRTLLFSFLSAIAVSAFAQDHMTPEMLWRLKRVGGGTLTPDKSRILFSSSVTDVQTEKRSTKYYSVTTAGADKKEWNMPEGKTIIQRDKKAWYATDDKSLYSSIDGGKTWTKICDGLEEADNVRVSPNGKYVAFSKEILITPILGSDIYADLPKTTARVYTDLNDRHWDTWEDGKFSHVFIMPIKGGNATDIMKDEPYDAPQKPFGGEEDMVWAPDSKGIVYVCKKKFGKAYATSTNTDIYYYNIAKQTTTDLTEGMMGYDTQPVFSPDGTRLAWTSMARDGFEADKVDVCIMDINKPDIKMNVTDSWDGTVEGITWSNSGNKIYFNAPWHGTAPLFAVNVGEDINPRLKPEVKQITNGDFDINGIVGQVGDNMIVSRCDMNHASELFSVNLSNGKMKAVTHENDEAYKSIKLSKTTMRMVLTTDKKDMGVWVIYPPDFDSTKKYPTLLYCQGGPQSALSQFYSFRWNFQLMAAQGYIVVAPNRRGMPGWGLKWNEDISKDWGGQPMRDYLSAIDAVSKEPYVDENRLGCVGASYGGYSVYMLAGMHNNRFKTFIAHDGLFDLKSWYGTTEELWFANYDIGGPYWANPQPKSYQDFNPSNFVDKWNTPIFIIQGGIDYRVPIEQGHEAFQAARLKGIKSKFLYLPNENHWVLHPQNAIVWQREFFKWLDETLK